MYKHLSDITVITVAACLIACSNSRKQQVDEFRRQQRMEYYQDKLQEAQRQLAATDSLLRKAETEGDSLDIRQRIYRCSLEQMSQLQGAKIRYIHRKQKEMLK